MVTEINLTLDSKHTIQYMDDVLQNYTLKTYNFTSQCQPNKFNNFLEVDHTFSN